MRKAISTPSAPAAIGPYSQAIDTGSVVYLSGQIPLDPATGEMVGSDTKTQVERVLDNVAAVLGAAELTFDSIAKTTIFLIDLGDFAVVNEAYAKRFSGIPPARSTIQVAALPRGARVEIEAIAVRQTSS